MYKSDIANKTISNFLEYHKKLPISNWEIDRWDSEWISYFMYHDNKPYFQDYHNFSIDKKFLEDLPNIQEEEMIHRKISPEFYETHLWVKGTDLINKNILEIGCGTGLIGKQLGLVVNNYLGLDYSPLALRIAKLISPDKCHYHHLSEADKMISYLETIDTMIGRNFFIHQNFETTNWLLKFAHFFLKKDGIVSADFYEPNPELQQGSLHPAKSPFTDQPSCGFIYKENELFELAQECGYKIENITFRAEIQRQFVRFVKI